MNKLKKIFSPRTMSVVLTGLIFLFSLQFVNMPAQSQTQAIVTAMAVDFVEDKVELACGIVTPTTSLDSKHSVYSAKADTFAESVELIGLQLGKRLAFAQCDVVALGPGMLEKGVVRALDYFTRTKKVGKNVLLVSFDGEAKEFIESGIYLQESLSLNLPQILKYNKEFMLAVDSNLENFYLGYYSNNGISIMPQITMAQENTTGGIEVVLQETSASDQGSQGGDGSGGGDKKLYFVNDGTTAVLKNGVKCLEISPKDTQKLNLFFHDAKYGTYKVEGISDDLYNNATVIMNMENKSSLLQYRWRDNKPTLELTLTMYLQVEEVVEVDKNKQLLTREDKLITGAVVDKIVKKIKENLDEAEKLMKENNIDVLGLNGRFDKFHHKKWKKYLEQEENKENYLNGIQFIWDINIAQYL